MNKLLIFDILYMIAQFSVLCVQYFVHYYFYNKNDIFVFYSAGLLR